MNANLIDATSTLQSYEDYIRRFFPKLEETRAFLSSTPQELGAQMARDTLSHIKQVLSSANDQNQSRHTETMGN